MLAASAHAQPEPWRHPDGTIHYYHAIAAPGGIDWQSALDSSLNRDGYLATITSQSENDFVYSLLDSSALWYQRPGSGLLAGPWLGAHRYGSSPYPDSGWQWDNSEPFGYRHWSPGEPDNAGGDEHALNFGEATGTRLSTWNDLSDGDNQIRGYVTELSADSTSVGLIRPDSGAYPGYTLFAPMMSHTTYLIDNDGRLVHSWNTNYHPGLVANLLESGLLLRSADMNNPIFSQAGGGGRAEELDWNSNLVWSYNYSDTTHCQHHDVEAMPNGHVLMIAWERKTRAVAIAAGRNPSHISEGELWPDHIIEVNPANDSIVWQWHIWDHLIQDYDSTKANYGVVANHSELIDVNFIPASQPNGPADWNHVNSVTYNADLDQIMISVHNFFEIWVIDHSTTTAQARGHSGGHQGIGGDLLYRWGNPLVYRAGGSGNKKFFGQHDARWIPAGSPGAGHITVYNNGLNRPGGAYSTIDEIIPPVDSAGHYTRPAPGTQFDPNAQCWIYGANPPTSFYSANISGATRLPNGNTLACEGARGRFTEVTHDSVIVWRYINPVSDSIPLMQGDTFARGIGDAQNAVFRVARYAADYPGLIGRNLTPGYPIERYGSPTVAIADPPQTPSTQHPTASFPSIIRDRIVLPQSKVQNPESEITILDASGRIILSVSSCASSIGVKSLAPGVYYCRFPVGSSVATAKFVKLE
jgi:hypothetical protein